MKTYFCTKKNPQTGNTIKMVYSPAPPHYWNFPTWPRPEGQCPWEAAPCSGWVYAGSAPRWGLAFLENLFRAGGLQK